MDNYLDRELTNLEKKIGYYLGRLNSDPFIPPEHVYFSLTNRCNLRCEMCDIPKYSSKEDDELSAKELKSIILQIKEMGVQHLIFSGGEPLLRKDLLELVEYAVAKNIKMVDIITNGTLLNDDIIKKLIKCRLSHITISLDGLSKINSEIRGQGVFEKAESNIDKFNYYKEKYKALFPTVGINFTIMDRNVSDILPMIDFAASKKCNIIVFQPVLFSNIRMHEKRTNSLWPSKNTISKLKTIFEEVIRMKTALGSLFIYNDRLILEAMPSYFEGKKLPDNFKCYEGIKRMVITYDGKLWGCKGVYGDLKKKTLAESWFSNKAMEMRKEVKKCKRHCFQDCVYFPSDISGEIKSFLKNIESISAQRKSCVQQRLLKDISNYRDILLTKKKTFRLDFSKWLNYRESIKFLHETKDKFLKEF